MTKGRYRSLNAGYTSAGVILLTLAILGGTVLFSHLHIREKIRKQIAGTHAQVLHALWLNQKFDLASGDDLDGITEDPADQLHTLLEMSLLPQLNGVLATRLFDGQGKFIIAVPPSTASDAEIDQQAFAQLQDRQPVSRFYPAVRLADLFPLDSSLNGTAPSPLLEISIPLHGPSQNRLLGVAQYIIDGTSVASEFKALDWHLMLDASVVFLVGGIILALAIGLAFRQLQQVNHLLTERTRSLLQANQELALAAKTSAVGAVTAHLIHGLKNPLSGLHHFMASRGSAPTGGSDTEWQAAVSTTRRMQSLVSETVRVLQEENSGACYELSMKELVEVISAHVLPVALRAGVRFQTRISAEGLLTNRDANLVILILENLIQNAIQATPKGKSVTLEAGPLSDKIVCQVQDEGSGLSERARQFLFKPCQSTKEGGSGIGLAISKQLAGYIGAELELTSNEPGRCVFALTLPASVVNPAESAIST